MSYTNCTDPFASPNQSTVYTAITENIAGCRDTVEIPIITKTCPTVGPCDSVSFNLAFTTAINGNDLIIYDQSNIPNNAQIDIFWGDGNSMGFLVGDTINYTYSLGGSYLLCVEAVLALGETLICSETLCDTVDILMSPLENKPFVQAVLLFPNPTTQSLKVEFPCPPRQNTTIILINMQGILVQEWKMENQQNHRLDLSQLPKAYYYLSIIGSDVLDDSRLILIK